DVLARETTVVDVVAHRTKHLARQHQRVARELPQRRAHGAFRFAPRIGVCHVEEVNASCIGGSDDSRDCRLVLNDLAEGGQAAKAERADLEPAMPQIAMLHRSRSFHGDRRPMKVEKKPSRSAAATNARST